MAPIQQVRIGTLTAIKYPGFVPYDGRQPWVVKTDAASSSLGAEIVEAVALQLLGQHRPGDAQCMLYESSPGPLLAKIKRLLAASDKQWGEQLFTAQQCQRRLAELEELAHRRYALLAQAGVVDLQAYNRSAARAEVVIYLVLNGIGNALADTRTLQQLMVICSKGPAVGIVPLLLNNGEGAHDLTVSTQMGEAVEGFWESISPQSVGFSLGRTVSPIGVADELWRLMQRFQLQLGVGQLSQTAADALLALGQHDQDANGEKDFLQIEVGTAGADPASFKMGEKSDVYHALIGGATRTGKSTLLNNLIISACEVHSPEQLQLTLMDFKAGVSFWEFDGLGHVSDLYAPLNDDFSAAIQCLERFTRQITDRYAMFRTARVDRLSDYNRVAHPLPRCLLIVDEAQKMFEGRNYSEKGAVKQLLSTLAKQGAAAGVHVILSTQSFQNVELEGDVKDQFHLRIGLRHASAMGCRALMGRDNDAMLTLPRFTAVFNSHQGEPQYNQVVALGPLHDFPARLEQLKGRFPGKRDSAPPTPKSVASAVRSSELLRGDVSEPW